MNIIIWVLGFVIKNQVITGYNSLDTRYGGELWYSCHAEMRAIFNLLKHVNGKTSKLRSRYNNLSFTGHTLYVCRVMKQKDNLPHGQTNWFGSAKPCEHCEQTIRRFGIKKVKYTDIIDGQQVLCTLSYK